MILKNDPNTIYYPPNTIYHLLCLVHEWAKNCPPLIDHCLLVALLLSGADVPGVRALAGRAGLFSLVL